MRRRPFGSIEQRNGRITIRWYHKASGKHPREALPPGSTVKDAERRLAELWRLEETGTLIEPSRMTCAELFAEWLKTAGHDWTPNTRVSYEYAVKRLLPVMGGWKAQKVTTLTQAEQVRRGLERTGPAPKTVNLTLGVAREAFNYALSHGWAAINPFALPAFKVPAPPKPDKTAHTAEQANRLYHVCLEPPEPVGRGAWTASLIIATALLTFRRIESELAGLRLDDVDLEARVMRVRQYYDQQHKAMREAGNSKIKRMDYPLSSLTVDVLKRQRALVIEARSRASDNGYKWFASGDVLVFPGYNGEPLGKTTIREQLARLCEIAGVPVISPHELRHTSTSLAASMGISEQQMQRMGGWSSPDVMRRAYVHGFDADLQRATEEYSQRLGKEA